MQSSFRISLETQAKLYIQEEIRKGHHELVCSYMLVYDKVNKSMELYAPDRFFSRVSFCNRPAIRLVGFEDLPEEAWDLEMTYRFDPINLNGTVRMQVYPLAFGVASASLPVIAPGRPGAYELYLWCESRNMKCKAVVGMTAWIYRE